MGVESKISRALDIRFIDARAIATEAKLSLGIEGYHESSRDDDIIQVAMRTYNENYTQDRKNKMSIQHQHLERIKERQRGSCSSSGSRRGSTSSSSIVSYDDEDCTSIRSSNRSRKGSDSSMVLFGSPDSNRNSRNNNKNRLRSLLPFRRRSGDNNSAILE